MCGACSDYIALSQRAGPALAGSEILIQEMDADMKPSHSAGQRMPVVRPGDFAIFAETLFTSFARTCAPHITALPLLASPLRLPRCGI